MEKEANVKEDIKNLRQGISSARIQAKAQAIDKAIAEEADELEKEVEEVAEVETETVVAHAVEAEETEEVEEDVDSFELTEEEIQAENELISKLVEEIEKRRKKYEPADFLKKLMDPENKDYIEFLDEFGQPLNFEQVALIPKDEKLFTILKPVEPEKVGLKDDEALVFSVEYNEDICEDYLERVTDEADIEILFQIYYDMLDEQGITE